MNFINNPPNASLSDQKGNATKVWANWFSNLFQGPAKAWVPVVTGITGTGAFSLSGNWTRSGAMIFFQVSVTPSSGNTTSIGGQITNFPFGTLFGQSCAYNSSTRAQIASVLVDSTVSIPAWSGISGPIVITGFAQLAGG